MGSVYTKNTLTIAGGSDTLAIQLGNSIPFPETEVRNDGIITAFLYAALGGKNGHHQANPGTAPSLYTGKPEEIRMLRI